MNYSEFNAIFTVQRCICGKILMKIRGPQFLREVVNRQTDKDRHTNKRWVKYTLLGGLGGGN